MKRLVSLLIFMFIGVGLFGQLPKIASKVKTLGTISEKPVGTAPTIIKFNALLTDTLKSTDTLFYKIPIIHSTVGYPYVTIRPKLIANDATATVTFWQSFDGVRWTQCNSVSNAYVLTAFTATVPVSTTLINEYSFWASNIKFDSQWFGMRFIAATNAGFKTLYYGSIRFNKAY
jgi:hypothetical protein